MKSLLVLLLLAVVAPAEAQTCCSAREISMYRDPAFIAEHAAPLPLAYESTGSMITFPTTGATANAYYVRAKHRSNKVLLVFHEWWGLNDYIRQESDRLASELGNVSVLAVDLFDGNVASTPDAASKYASQASPERMHAIIQGALDYVNTLNASDTTLSIGTLGWCFGGGWSLQAAMQAGVMCNACVMYYGMPDTSAASLAKLKAPVLGLFGSKDKYITPAIVNNFSQVATAAGKSVEVKEYDADHAFANPSNPNANLKAAADANKRALAFLRAHL